ncbi:MAG TPA: cytochrome P450 [Solimonas sp.]|nr:cytochrome P450 [Solimonas sp.]
MHELSHIPGNNGWPLVGHAFQYLFNFEQFTRDYFKRYGDVARFHAFGLNFVDLLGPEANQFVMQNRDDLFRSGAWEKMIGPFFHRGLMLLDGEEHRLHRRVMQAAFTNAALREDLQGINRTLADSLAAWPTGEGVRVFDLLKSMTLDIASRVFLGQPAGKDSDALNRAFLATVQAATGVVRKDLPGTRWRAGLRGRKLLVDHFSAELAMRRQSTASDLFTRLCHARTDDGVLFSDEDVINHLVFLLMAAHDTSTITLTNLMYQLARQPAWQERLREQSRALGRDQLDYEDLERLEDMDRAMKETLRLTPPVPGLPREATREFEYGGHRIPAGTLVSISIWMTHRLEKWWKDPEAFDPDRYAPGRAEDKQHPFLWLPFGGGAHKCIGMHFGAMEVKAALHQLLLRFRWSVPQDYVMPQDWTSLPIPKDRLPLRLERLQ